MRIEACNERVTVVADRAYLNRETLSSLCARLPPNAFVRVHRSHAVSVAAIVEARHRGHGEYALRLRDGSTIVSWRSFRASIEALLGIAARDRRVA